MFKNLKIENKQLVSRLSHVIVVRTVYACSEGSLKHAQILRLARATAANRQTVGIQINVQIKFRYLALLHVHIHIYEFTHYDSSKISLINI